MSESTPSRRPRRLLRRLMLFGAAGLLLAVVAQLGVQAHNARRLGWERWEGGTERWLERSRAIRDRANFAYQHDVTGNLPASAFNGETRRLDEELFRAESDLDLASREDGAIGSILFELSFDDPAEPGLASNNEAMPVNLADGTLRVKSVPDALLASTLPMDIPRDEVADILIRVRSHKGTRLVLGWSPETSDDTKRSGNISIDLISDGEFHTYQINGKNVLKRGLRAGESVKRLGLVPSNVEGDEVEIDFIRFISKLAKFSTQPFGTDYETLGRELRRVLYLLPGQRLTYTLEIPSHAPRLTTGVGMLRAEPLEFAVHVIDGSGETTILEQRVDIADAWSDLEADLTPWAGRSVELVLETRGPPDNVGFWSSPTLREPRQQPLNVILILEDTLRADYLSGWGYGRPSSPFRDRLAAEGHQFRFAVSQATKTRPSVPSLMTSLLPSATGVWSFSDALADEFLTLAEIMRAQGFETASFIQNGNAGPYAGGHQGFDRLLDEELIGPTTPELFGPRLISWLEQRREDNFFLYLHVRDPHGPYEPPSPFDDWYRSNDRGDEQVKRESYLDPEWEGEPTAEGRRNLYAGEILHNDSIIAGFHDELSRLGLVDDTVIVFVSDHGEYMGEYDLWEHQPPGLRPVVHVPIIVSAPGLLPGSTAHDVPVQLIDVAPTILDLAGIDTKRLPLHGDSLVELIEGDAAGTFAERLVISEEPMTMRRQQACGCGSVFMGDWHLIASRTFSPVRFEAPWKLRVYDWQQELTEPNPYNLFSTDLRLKRAFGGFLTELQETNISAWREISGGPAESTRVDPEVLERLRTLGYVQ